MKKNISKLFALLLALMMALSLAACGGDSSSNPSSNPTQSGGGQTQQPSNEPAQSGGDTNWTAYTEDDWTSENWDSKTVSYQFTGEWSLPENDIYFYFLINLYDDGSVLVEQHSPVGNSYEQYGYWSEENTADGNEISLDTLWCTPDLTDSLVAHEYHYDLYEESDGGYSFGYTFGIAAGSFFRDVDVAGSSTIEYASVAAFTAACDSAFNAGGGAESGAPESDAPEADVPADAIATYSTEAGLSLILFEGGAMRVEFPSASMSRDGFTYELSADGATLTVTGTPDAEAMGAFAQIWDVVGGKVWIIDGSTATAKETVATYDTGSLNLILFADGTMRVEFPQASMGRNGFAYELSADGATLTVTGTPSEEDMGAFAQIWAGVGATVWTIDGTTATPA